MSRLGLTRRQLHVLDVLLNQPEAVALACAAFRDLGESDLAPEAEAEHLQDTVRRMIHNLSGERTVLPGGAVDLPDGRYANRLLAPLAGRTVRVQPLQKGSALVRDLNGRALGVVTPMPEAVAPAA